MQELVQEIQKIIKYEIRELKDDINELKNNFKELKDDVRVLSDRLSVIEHDHGEKINAIYDLICLDKEINAPKFEKINKISEKVEKNQLHILNLENKVSILEKNIS